MQIASMLYKAEAAYRVFLLACWNIRQRLLIACLVASPAQTADKHSICLILLSTCGIGARMYGKTLRYGTQSVIEYWVPADDIAGRPSVTFLIGIWE